MSLEPSLRNDATQTLRLGHAPSGEPGGQGRLQQGWGLMTISQQQPMALRSSGQMRAPSSIAQTFEQSSVAGGRACSGGAADVESAGADGTGEACSEEGGKGESGKREGGKGAARGFGSTVPGVQPVAASPAPRTTE